MARSFRLILSATLAFGATAQAQACSDDEGVFGVVDDDAGRGKDVPDGRAASRDGDAPLATMRLAHLAPEIGPIDFCYEAVRSGAFEGPVLGGFGREPDASADGEGDGGLDLDAMLPIDADLLDASLAPDAPDVDGGDAGAPPSLGYASVSKYMSLDATGTLLVAIVPAGSTTCAGAIAQGTVTLDPGKLSTVALFGAGGAADAGDGGLGVVAFTDDRDTKPDKARVRMINATSSAVSVRVVAAQTTVVADRVDPRHASSSSDTIPVDALGFATVAPMPPPASIAVVPVGASDASLAEAWQSGELDLDLRGGSVHTGFVLPSAIAWCADESTTGDLTACVLVR